MARDPKLKSKNLAMMVALLAFVVLVFIVSIVRMSGAS